MLDHLLLPNHLLQQLVILFRSQGLSRCSHQRNSWESHRSVGCLLLLLSLSRFLNRLLLSSLELLSWLSLLVMDGLLLMMRNLGGGSRTDGKLLQLVRNLHWVDFGRNLRWLLRSLVLRSLVRVKVMIFSSIGCLPKQLISIFLVGIMLFIMGCLVMIMVMVVMLMMLMLMMMFIFLVSLD